MFEAGVISDYSVSESKPKLELFIEKFAASGTVTVQIYVHILLSRHGPVAGIIM